MIVDIIVDIAFNIGVISMLRLFPGIIDEGFWSPGMEDRNRISVIDDDLRWPFAHILRKPHIGVIGNTTVKHGTKLGHIKMVEGEATGWAFFADLS